MYISCIYVYKTTLIVFACLSYITFHLVLIFLLRINIYKEVCFVTLNCKLPYDNMLLVSAASLITSIKYSSCDMLWMPTLYPMLSMHTVVKALCITTAANQVVGQAILMMSLNMYIRLSLLTVVTGTDVFKNISVLLNKRDERDRDILLTLSIFYCMHPSPPPMAES